MSEPAGNAAPRYAAIDIGTNTLKLTIVERVSAHELHPILEAGVTTRIGEGIEGRLLGEEPMRRTLGALERCVAACAEHGVERVFAVGTSALRDAQNRDVFLRRALAIGLSVEVLSGDEEARLSARSVRSDPLWREAEHIIVVDIGGGSTEIVFASRDATEQVASVSLHQGVVRLTEAAVKSDPPTDAELEDAARRADAVLSNVAWPWPPESATLVGVGGTITNLAAVHAASPATRCESIHGSTLTANEVERQIRMYAGMTIEARKAIPGLDPSRADVIIAGAIILSRTMATLGVSTVAVSCRGLRWGLLYDRLGI
ncbi:MAG: Ppx/GppA family phosphatase [Acidobacteria bacterium]|nr:Ppx/GppA family phosphatase [Acidobacteriota bacterium]